jgi:hypothetical protein
VRDVLQEPALGRPEGLDLPGHLVEGAGELARRVKARNSVEGVTGSVAFYRMVGVFRGCKGWVVASEPFRGLRFCQESPLPREVYRPTVTAGSIGTMAGVDSTSSGL